MDTDSDAGATSHMPPPQPPPISLANSKEVTCASESAEDPVDLDIPSQSTPDAPPAQSTPDAPSTVVDLTRQPDVSKEHIHGMIELGHLACCLIN